MLFKKKDQNESAKAKTKLQAGRAKQVEALEKKEEAIAAKTDKGSAKADAGKKINVGSAAGRANPMTLRNPRITEKATDLSAMNVYAFDVAVSANKATIASAIKDVYGVTPAKIRVITIKPKAIMSRRGTHSLTAAGKKAYVYLKKGDTIEIV